MHTRVSMCWVCWCECVCMHMCLCAECVGANVCVHRYVCVLSVWVWMCVHTRVSVCWVCAGEELKVSITYATLKVLYCLEFLGSTCCCLPSGRITGTHCNTQLFTRVLGIRTYIFLFAQQALNHEPCPGPFHLKSFVTYRVCRGFLCCWYWEICHLSVSPVF